MPEREENMEELVKGKTFDGDWYVRPISWDNNAEYRLGEHALAWFKEEERADLYMDVYKLLALVDEEVNKMPVVTKRLFVYDMADDCEWWVSDLSPEETAEAYCEEYGFTLGVDIKIDDINECNQNENGMFWNFDENEEISGIIKKLCNSDESEKVLNIEVGGLKCEVTMYYEGPSIYVPFSKAIRLDGEYKEPHMIATTEC